MGISADIVERRVYNFGGQGPSVEVFQCQLSLDCQAVFLEGEDGVRN